MIIFSKNITGKCTHFVNVTTPILMISAFKNFQEFSSRSFCFSDKVASASDLIPALILLVFNLPKQNLESLIPILISMSHRKIAVFFQTAVISERVKITNPFTILSYSLLDLCKNLPLN